ncbi:ATP-binding cassette domain-containing protein [Rhizobium redzepovicii]|uniref:ATP-binding cassette domain-containing protein n=1 Tax=Rhizobium redzepovicii TaxID=2867518 RepID=UPI001C92D4FB|nr:ATP-binding cassette domain-containing protein [Rhizobium redzepovicii]MBY4617899.1 ATP-binding cassette domain-containing protein [Rhizobium redzepovicii]
MEWQTLDHITFCIQAGEHTAIVGSTGLGKSTLGYLLARLDDPDRGRVTLDGIDLKSFGFDTGPFCAIRAFFCSTKRPARSTRKPKMLRTRSCVSLMPFDEQ